MDDQEVDRELRLRAPGPGSGQSASRWRVSLTLEAAYRHDPLNWHLLPDGFQAPGARIFSDMKKAPVLHGGFFRGTGVANY